MRTQVAFIPSLLSAAALIPLMRAHGVPFVAGDASVRLLTVLRGLFGAAALTLVRHGGVYKHTPVHSSRTLIGRKHAHTSSTHACLPP